MFVFRAKFAHRMGLNSYIVWVRSLTGMDLITEGLDGGSGIL